MKGFLRIGDTTFELNDSAYVARNGMMNLVIQTIKRVFILINH